MKLGVIQIYIILISIPIMLLSWTIYQMMNVSEWELKQNQAILTLFIYILFSKFIDSKSLYSINLNLVLRQSKIHKI